MPDTADINESSRSVSQRVSGERNIFAGTGNISVVNNYEAVGSKDRLGLSLLLSRVKQLWIEGFLKNSLEGRVLINARKQFFEDAIEHPLQMESGFPEHTDQSITSDNILTVFNTAGRLMLLLGEPGYGKTIALLDLARKLIEDANGDVNKPIPVILNLSTWTDIHQSLFDWLVGEISAKYKIGKIPCRSWLEQQRLLLLLDGLDEVKHSNRAACVDAINRFAEEVGVPGIVVCCRPSEYTELQIKLKFIGAICLQPFTDHQIWTYLAESESSLDDLRTALEKDSVLMDLAKSPLMLWIMSMTYEDRPAESLEEGRFTDVDALHERVFTTYVQRMVERNVRAIHPYNKEQMTCRLSWLASKMREHYQTIFLIEQLQPSWLSTHRERWAYAILSRLTAGIMLGFVFGLVAILNGGLLFMMLVWLSVGISAGLASGLIHGSRLKRSTSEDRPVLAWTRKFEVVLITGLLPAVIGLLVGELVARSYTVLQSLSIFEPFTDLSFAAATFTVFGLRSSREGISWDIHTFETLNWSVMGALLGGVAGLVVAVVLSLTVFAVTGQVLNISRSVLFIITPLCFLLGLSGAIYGGTKVGLKDIKNSPNEGIKLSIKNMLVVTFRALIGMLIIATLLLFVGFYDVRLLRNVVLPLGLVVGIVFVLRYGALDVIQHYTLRYILKRNGYFPLDCTRLLDRAVKLIFLRRVGGGYIFVHGFLLDYFADLKK